MRQKQKSTAAWESSQALERVTGGSCILSNVMTVRGKLCPEASFNAPLKLPLPRMAYRHSSHVAVGMNAPWKRLAQSSASNQTLGPLIRSTHLGNAGERHRTKDHV